MLKRILAVMTTTALVACGANVDGSSAVKDSSTDAPTCTATINPAGYPQYAGAYNLYIDSIFASAATLEFTPAYPQVAGSYHLTYDLSCAHLAGWPSYAVCTESSFDVAKFTVSYSGEATLGVANADGSRIDLGALVCR